MCFIGSSLQAINHLLTDNEQVFNFSHQLLRSHCYFLANISTTMVCFHLFPTYIFNDSENFLYYFDTLEGPKGP